MRLGLVLGSVIGIPCALLALHLSSGPALILLPILYLVVIGISMAAPAITKGLIRSHRDR